MADNAFEELGKLHSGFSDLARIIPTQALIDFQVSLNNIAVQIGQNSSVFSQFNRSLQQINQTTTISQTQFARYTAEYVANVNRINLSMTQFVNLATAANRIDPFNTDQRIRGLLQYSNQYGAIVGRLFESYNKEAGMLRDLKDAYRLREVAFATGNNEMGGFIEALIRGDRAQENFASRSQKLVKSVKDASLSFADFVVQSRPISAVLDAISGKSGGSALAVGAGAVGLTYMMNHILPAVKTGIGGTTSNFTQISKLAGSFGMSGLDLASTMSTSWWESPAATKRARRQAAAVQSAINSGGGENWANLSSLDQDIMIANEMRQNAKNLAANRVNFAITKGLPALVGVAGGISNAANASSAMEMGAGIGSAIGSLGYLIPEAGPVAGGVTTMAGTSIGGLVGHMFEKGQTFNPYSEKEKADQKLVAAAEALERSAHVVETSFAYAASASAKNIGFIREEWENPLTAEGSKRALIQARLGYQGALVGTGQVPVSTQISLQRELISSIAGERGKIEEEYKRFQHGESYADLSTKRYLASIGHAGESWIDPAGRAKLKTELSPTQIATITHIGDDANEQEKTPEAVKNQYEKTIADLKKQEIESMHLVRRSYMEQFTGQAMGLANGTYTMPSMMSDRGKYGGSYVESSGAAGFLPLTKADIASRAAQQRYGDRWGIRWASQQANPIAGAVADAAGIGGGNGIIASRNASGAMVYTQETRYGTVSGPGIIPNAGIPHAEAAGRLISKTLAGPYGTASIDKSIPAAVAQGSLWKMADALRGWGDSGFGHKESYDQFYFRQRGKTAHLQTAFGTYNPYAGGNPTIRSGGWGGSHSSGPAKDETLQKIASLIEKGNQIASGNQIAYERGLTSLAT